jgi:hypothetical protein
VILAGIDYAHPSRHLCERMSAVQVVSIEDEKMMFHEDVLEAILLQDNVKV